MEKTLKSAWPLFFGIAMIMIGNGLQGTLLGIRATMEDFSTSTTGLIMSLYYTGFLAGSILAPKLVQEVGHIRVFAALASLASTTSLLHGLFVDPIAWAIARAVTGFALAGLYIVVESWMNDISNNQNRGKMLGFYLFTFYGAMVIGQYLLNVASPDSIELFVLISVLVSLALLPISLIRRPAPDFETPSHIGAKELAKTSPLGVYGVLISGLGVSVFFTVGPVYAAQSGMSVADIANFMAAFIMGGVIGQMPLGYFSDKFDRRKVLLLIALVSSIMAVVCSFFAESGSPLFYLTLFFFGGFSLSIYAISAAYTNDHLEQEQFVGASAMLILINGAGAILGPFSVSVIMSIFGNNMFFLSMGAIYTTICIFGLYRVTVSDPIPQEDQGDFIAMPLRSSVVAAQIADEDTSEPPKADD